jgi:hypothetical protein
MKVTRDVIYDLLPGYFAGEATPDTRALVDEFLRDDPEFAHMMQRFRAVFRDQPPADDAAVSRERQTFDRARGILHKRSELRGYTIAFGLAAVFPIAMQLFLGRPFRVGLWAITLAFAFTSAVSGVQWYWLQQTRPELRRPVRPSDV